MSYQLIEDYTLDFTGGPFIPKGWAIHHWGDPAQKPTFTGILNVLINRSALKQASVNFMAEAGKVACLVNPFTIAWGQGDGAYGWGNNNLVSLECNPRCTAEDRETVAELIADQNIKNGIPIVLYPHKNFTSTACPGLWEKWIPWLTERAKQIVKEKTLANTGDIVADSGFHPTEEWYAAMIGAQSRIDARTYYVRAIGSDTTVYDVSNGSIRALTLPEWNVLSALHWPLKDIDPKLIDDYVTDYKARNPN